MRSALSFLRAHTVAAISSAARARRTYARAYICAYTYVYARVCVYPENISKKQRRTTPGCVARNLHVILLPRCAARTPRARLPSRWNAKINFETCRAVCEARGGLAHSTRSASSNIVRARRLARTRKIFECGAARDDPREAGGYFFYALALEFSIKTFDSITAKS